MTQENEIPFISLLFCPSVSYSCSYTHLECSPLPSLSGEPLLLVEDSATPAGAGAGPWLGHALPAHLLPTYLLQLSSHIFPPLETVQSTWGSQRLTAPTRPRFAQISLCEFGLKSLSQGQDPQKSRFLKTANSFKSLPGKQWERFFICRLGITYFKFRKIYHFIQLIREVHDHLLGSLKFRFCFLHIGIYNSVQSKIWNLK